MTAAPSRTVTPTHELGVAEQYLQLLDPNAELFTFVLLHDAKRGQAATFHSSLGDVWPRIRAANSPAGGCGVFVAVNETNFTGRKAEHIVRARALFIDADNADSVEDAERIIRETNIEPSLRVISSGGRMHFYWIVDDLALDQFTPLQKALAELFGSDKAVVDLPRIMRLPGTLHLKGAPQLVRLQVGTERRRYMAADIVKGLGLDGADGAQITSKSNRIFELGGPDNVVRLLRRDSSDVLQNDSELAAGIEWEWFVALDDDGKNQALRQMLDICAELALGSRADWIKVLMAARASGASRAEELAREWSRPDPRYSDAEFEKDWDSFGRSARSGGITIGSLIKEATRRGFDNLTWREYAARIRARAASQSSENEASAPERPAGRIDAAVSDALVGGSYTPQRALTMMNERYAVVSFENSGEVAIVRHNRGNPVIMREKDAQLELANVSVSQVTPDGPKRTPIFKWWRENKDRDSRRREIFDPDKPSGTAGTPDEFNFWQGFAVDPVEGDDKIIGLLNHIWRIICKEDQEKYNYLISWLAWTVQNPGRHPSVAVVLHSSAEGAGKSLLGEVMVRIFGRHGLTISDNARLLGNHDEHLEFACFVLIEEALFAGDAKTADKIKSRLASDTVTINPKFRPARSVPNRLSAMLCTNHEWAVLAGKGARRWFVLSVAETRVGDLPYFRALHVDLADGGDGQFLNYLQKLELGDWHPRAVPKTAELAIQQLMGLPKVYAWLWECASSGRILEGKQPRGPLLPTLGEKIDTAAARDAFNDWVRDQGGRTENEIAIGKLLTRVLGPPKRATGGTRHRYYSLPQATELKKRIMDAYGIKLPARTT
jgi:uncharacterized protein DUF5906/primase-like protein/DNA primase RepB-like protein